MPPIAWPVDANLTVRRYGSRVRVAEAEALLLWSIWTVESLYYLDDIDAAYDRSRESIGEHRPDVVDVAHGRWATVSCVTALDLVAAALARVYSSHSGPREVRLSDLNPQAANRGRAKKAHALRAPMPLLAQKWLDDALGDTDYVSVCAARHSLAHARSPRHFRFEDEGPARLGLSVGHDTLSLRTLVTMARDTATRHLVHLLNVLPQL